jgi:hypothetical protein
MKNIFFACLTCFALLTSTMSSCYYDKAELLYPDSACDTAGVGYSASILPILTSSCYSCHAGNTPSGGIRLDSYVAVAAVAANGKLWGAVSHTSGSPMPKNAPKLGNCDLKQIKLWLDAGHPNN